MADPTSQARYPSRRTDLLVQTERVEGVTYYTVKSPLTGKFIRLREPEFYLLNLLDGAHSVEEAAADFVRTYNKSLTPEAVEQFAGQLGEIGFLQGVAAAPDRGRRSVLFITLKAFDPDRLLDWMYPKLRWLFSAPAIWGMVLLIVLGMAVFFANISHFPFNLYKILSGANLVAIIVTLFVIFVVHEFAHALTCKHFGGSVREMGVLLLYFQPCVYCNLSDAYLFPQRRQRIITMFAGIFFQLLLWAVASILWRITVEDHFLNHILYVIVAVCFATLVFNLNPAIKLDGYYVLSDYFQIPNLRQKAFNYIWNRVKVRLFGCAESELLTPTAREQRIYWRYGLTALLYSTALILFVLYRGGELLIGHWGGTGFILFVGLSLLIFKRLIASTFARMAEVWRERGAVWMKPKRLIVYGAALIILVLLLILIRVEQKAGGPARLIASESLVVKRVAPSLLESSHYRGGVLERNSSRVYQLSTTDYAITQISPLVAVGDTVRAGDTLLIINSTLNRGMLTEAQYDLKRAEADRRLLLSDPKVEAVATKRSEIKEAEARYEAARKEFNRMKELHSRKLISDDEYERASAIFNVSHSAWNSKKNELQLLRSAPKVEEVERVDAEIEKLRARVRYLEEQLDESAIISPFDGVLVGTSAAQDLLHLARTDSLVVEVALDQADLDILAPGSQVELRVGAYPTVPHRGTVIKLKLSPDLHAIAAVANPDKVLLPEMSGYAKVSCGKISLGGLLVRKLLRFFRLEFWSWF